MKIAQITCTYPPYKGGIGNSAKQFSEFMLNRGDELAVFTPKTNNDLECEKEVVLLDSFLKKGNAALMHGLFGRLSAFDLVVLHYPFFGANEILLLDKLLSKKKYRLIIHYHMDTLSLSFVNKVFALPSRLIENKLFDKAEKISCASFDYIENSSIKNYYTKNKDKFIEVPFGVDTDKFIPADKSDRLNRKILFVGGMDKAHDFKGVDVLLRAFSRIQDKKAKLSLVGEGELRGGYEKLANNLNIKDSVTFLGKLDEDDLVKAYQESDLFVLPSVNSHEAFGIVQIEALSCGVPVISTNLPGVRSVINRKCGLSFEVGDDDDLSKKIDFIFSDEIARRMMSKEARNLAMSKYDKRKVSEKFLKVIDGKI